ncbi:unnamed protein product, partial [Ectocarpus sp. 12 AP-2014]
TTQAIIALTDGYTALENNEEVLQRVYITENTSPGDAREELVKADTGSSYGFIHAIYHPHFTSLRAEMKYYDIVLIDPDGNIVYSVAKRADFASNLVTGEWKDTGLGDAFREAIALGPNDPSVFVDFQRHGPSNQAPAAFISRPIFNDQGTLLGVLAYQMPNGKLSSTVNSLEGLGETADGFLVGEDA